MADDNATFQQVRDALKEANKRIKELEGYETEAQGYRQADAMRSLGFDPESKQGKALLKLHDGDITADALRETAESYGITAPTNEGEEPAGEDAPLPQATRDRLGAQRQMDEVRSTATPQAGKLMSYADFQTLTETDGAAAIAAWQSGQVEVPDHIASQVAANNRQTSTLLGR